MANIILPKRWRRQQYGEVDRAHPLARGLYSYTVANPFGLINLMTMIRSVPEGLAPIASTLTSGIGRRVYVVSAGSANRDIITNPAVTAVTPGSVTIYALGAWGSGTAGATPADFATSRMLYGMQFNSSGHGIAVGRASTTDAFVSCSLTFSRGWAFGVTLTVGQQYSIFGWKGAGSSLLAGQIDNGPVVTGGTALTQSASFNAPVEYFGNPSTTVAPGDKTLLLGAFWLRELSDGERAAMVENPWQLLKPRRNVIYFDVGATAATISGYWGINA